MESLPEGFENFEPCDLRGVGRSALIAVHGTEPAEKILTDAAAERERMREEMRSSFPAAMELAGEPQITRGRVIAGDLI